MTEEKLKKLKKTILEIHNYIDTIYNEFRTRPTPFEWSADETGRAVANIIRRNQEK